MVHLVRFILAKKIMSVFSLKNIEWDFNLPEDNLPEEILFIQAETSKDLPRVISEWYGAWPSKFEYVLLTDEEADETALNLLLGACHK